MINRNELRYGNKVISKTHNLLNATFEGSTPHNLVFLKEVSSYEVFDNLEPIPLTPEILEAAGFERRVDKKFGKDWLYLYLNLGAIFGIEYINDAFRLDIANEYEEVLDIKYLHQLQNLYFVLMGEELTINLHAAV